MTIHLHRASRTDQLAEGLGELLATPLADPFATDVVVVPTHGVERWLSQRLADRLGVCAGVDFKTPWSLFAALRDDDDPWSPDAIVWPLLDVIDESLGEDWAAPLAHHLGEDREGEERELRRGRRFATARRLSRLFGAYATQRPSLIVDWAAGKDTDGAGSVLPTDLAWQPRLWRALAGRMEAVPPHVRQAEAIRQLREEPGASDLPPRLSLFGHTRMSVVDAELVGALGVHRDVHLWLPHPSAPMWESLQDLSGSVARADDRSHERLGHPLLRSLGRDVRELQRTVGPIADEVSVLPDPAATDTLLGWLQSDLRADAVSTPRTLTADDRSVQIHGCHGPARQVEVLREVLLGLLADDPTLEPRDIVVMCPDVEAYAPLILSVFGSDGTHPAGRLRLSLADRAADQINPLLDVLMRLVDLADGRAAADVLLDLAAAAPVRRRFGWDDSDLETLEAWVREAGIRWGFDVAHRAEFGLGEFVSNTWEFGLDRLALGAAMSADSRAWVDRTLPLDAVGSADLETAGRVMEFVDRVQMAADSLRGYGTASDWRDSLERALDAIASPTDTWQRGHVQRTLRERLPATSAHLQLADVRALLADAFAGRPTRSSFRTGAITVCTMAPMRSVPHRVVCVVGIDDGVFPRVGITDGDDVLARAPRTGERDVRSEDRQLLLDAVMAATQTLVITYTGADVHSGQTRPPSVPLGELLDALDDTATAAGGRASEVVTRHHPLQPHDARNFASTAPFSFDRVALAAAQASVGVRTRHLKPVDDQLPAETGDINLADLVAFFGGPTRAYFKQRLEVTLPRDEEPLDVAIPIEAVGLDEWSIGDCVLRDLLSGASIEDVRQREWRRGALPPGRLGWRRLTEIIENALPVARGIVGHRQSEPRVVDVDVDLGAGRRLRGSVADLYGHRIAAASYSRLNGKARLQSWVRLLALTAADPDHAWASVTVGRGRGGTAEMSQFGHLDHRADEWLRELIAVFDAGRRQPIPLPLKSSYAYAEQRHSRRSVEDAIKRADTYWYADQKFNRPGERDEPVAVAAWGHGATLLDFGPPLPGEEFPGETTRFGALAMRVWSPLFAAEVGR
ncbi:RecBCD enzyme subunit RecC [Nocardioides baekrokdamisoli]|uniref:RecBCD enzyme subunit RecC n=1 Tax=Nocardioides baekrokdamisoli TaxID=1804624 RepID=A0A3G9J3J3_9ACTN|nr:exodeoxyribonuclease V subunit gamma [Nocardioides baekrokdamisoli]BBH17579.1 RecBCD enzyme subunit RecC [Nocardioides baekrokdamisoli]